MKSTSRLHGLDLARLVAFIGMVIVNFKVVMLSSTADTDNWYYSFVTALEGRAAATFVVLAGIGLGLAAQGKNSTNSNIITLRRAIFLLVLGLLNSLIFEADILHYYAFYFVFAMLLLPFSNGILVCAIIALNAMFIGLLALFDYNTGWDWSNLAYHDFWTPTGFIRNLFFNGWHPVIPWLSFLLFGIILSRFKLGSRKLQYILTFGGAVVLLLTHGASNWLVANSGDELSELFTISPVPPMPLYILAGISFACMAIGACLVVANLKIFHWPMQILTPAGRQTLTLYIAHILLGMGTLETLNMLENQNIQSVFTAVMIFCSGAIIYALIWSKFFKRGPIEALMRKAAG